jgi:hypothetical protein
MTEGHWLTRAQPRRMFALVRHRATERQRRLFALACGRRRLDSCDAIPAGLFAQHDPALLILQLAEWWIDRQAECPQSSGVLPFIQAWASSRVRTWDLQRLCEEVLDLALHPDRDDLCLTADAWDVVQLLLFWGAYQGAERLGIYQACEQLLDLADVDNLLRPTQADYPLFRQLSRSKAALLPLTQVHFCCPSCGWEGPDRSWVDLHRALAGDVLYWLGLEPWTGYEDDWTDYLEGDVPSRAEVLDQDPTRLLEDYQWRQQCADILRDLFGNPFRPVAVDPSWLAWQDGTVRALAQNIYDEQVFADLPVLADALEEAGCQHRPILEHCRRPARHVRGCWVLDLLLSRQ